MIILARIIRMMLVGNVLWLVENDIQKDQDSCEGVDTMVRENSDSVTNQEEG